MIVTFVDGSVEEWTTDSPIGLQPGLLLINQGGESHVGIPMQSIKYWRLEGSRLAVARPPLAAKPLQ